MCRLWILLEESVIISFFLNIVSLVFHLLSIDSFLFFFTRIAFLRDWILEDDLNLLYMEFETPNISSLFYLLTIRKSLQIIMIIKRL